MNAYLPAVIIATSGFMSCLLAIAAGLVITAHRDAEGR